MGHQETEKVKYHYGQEKIIAGIKMEFVEYLEDGSEVWSHFSGGKENLYHTKP